ncbi:protein-L-isoaspartate O-methyltransferase [Haloactinospora alba]|uniref:Protein-L-isoaspartate O-methyltransferase n=2 Tax=Haloactinospora alba TaxID=405555 RepID=A0A543N9P5_9ACTN|nr:protein-L-isoaspartate O-methyltransferase [Haloactinospora alba]
MSVVTHHATADARIRVTPMDTTAHQLHTALTDALVHDGTLTDERLVAAFRATPRHLFIPEHGARTPDGTELDARERPHEWYTAVYTDAPVITQTDSGTLSPGQLTPTSSSSAPSVVARMLETAELTDGQRVLEIGTGTGWNAALLAARLGDANVTTVDIDPAVAAAARTALSRAGHAVTPHHHPGEHGYPPHAPYHRVIATCSVTRLPRPWIDQTTSGGLIVAPWCVLEGAGVLARLCVSAGGEASGHFHGGLGFMCLRSQRPPTHQPHDAGQRPETTRLTDTDPTAPLTAFDSAFPLTFMVPSWRMGPRAASTGTGVWLSATDSPSWARLLPRDGQWVVEQGGPRRLHDELAAAHQRWRDLGSPTPERYGLTVTREGTHRVWLDSPTGPAWTLPD